ncbi:MAG: hypothetical protein ACQESC_01660 [Nanobdellota archaeon]
MSPNTYSAFNVDLINTFEKHKSTPFGKKYFPLSLNELFDKIIDGPSELENPENKLLVKKLVEGKLFNIDAFTEFAYRESMRLLGIPLSQGSYGSISIKNEQQLVKEVTSKFVFPKSSYHQFAHQQMNLKEFNKTFPGTSHPLVRRLKQAQQHFNSKDSYMDHHITSLFDYHTDLTFDRFRPKYQSKALFSIRKRKIPYRLARKKALKRAENNSRELKKKQLKPESIDDVGGFFICSPESVYMNSSDHKHNTVFKVLNAFGKHPAFYLDYDEKKDNYYINGQREMEGVQAYLRPSNLEALSDHGFCPPYIQLIGSTSPSIQKNLVTSIHLQGPRAFLTDKIGKSSHQLYVLRNENDIDSLIKVLDPKNKLEYYNTIDSIKKYCIPGWSGNLTTVK